MNNLAAIFLSIALTFSLTTTTWAQPSDRFPDSVQVEVNGQTMRAFSRENFVLLLHLDADLTIRNEEISLLGRQIGELTTQINELELANSLLAQNISLLSEDRDRITGLWEEQNLRLHEAENIPRASTIFGWTIAAILAVVVGGFIVATTVRR